MSARDAFTVTLDADAAIVYITGSTKDAANPAFRRIYELALQRMAAAGDKTDPDTGEVEPRRWRLIFGEDIEDLTLKQRGFLHGVIFKQLAEKLPSMSDDPKAWKELYRRMFLGTDGHGNRFVMRRLPGWKKAVPLRERVSTEDLSKKQYSDYIDKVWAHATGELGCEFDYDPAEREAVRYRRPSQKRPTREVTDD